MKKLLLLTITLAISLQTASQQPPANHDAGHYLASKNEVYFSFQIPGQDTLATLSSRISIDHVVDKQVFAYANTEGFRYFLDHDIPYTVRQHPGDVAFDLNMKTWEDLQQKDLTDSWDFYPTYEAYVSLMESFEQDFPDMVEIVNIGETVLGRDMLFARISSGLENDRPVPQFMYTSTIHGDETTGFILSLRLIHHLLHQYGEDEEITALLDNAEVWICPNENPDGTYTNNNSTVSGATRGNANGIDLNRNYPNPVNDPWYDEQVETTNMINFTDTMNFIMSANMHGGIELVNYPFDSWKSYQNKHADHDWWDFVMYEYVDTVHQYSPPGYMTGMGDGVTHGGDWYVVYGSRQDYFNYYRSCREFTLELSNQKLLNPDLLPDHWEYNYRSLLNYIRQSTYGVHGLVYDNDTGQPLDAEIAIPGYDKDNSEVVTSMPSGYYNRPLLAGTYDFQYSADGYASLDVDNIPVDNYQTTPLNIAFGEGVSGDIVSVSIDKEGEGTVSPYIGTELFNQGANVFLEATPDELWELDKWVINGEEYQDSSITFALDEDTDIVAYFVETNMLPVIAINPDALDFGGGIVGELHESVITIANQGEDVLEIDDLSITGDEMFFLEPPVKDTPLVIEPGEDESVPVYFMPADAEEYQATLHIDSNDPNSPYLDVPLSGYGIEETPVIVLSTDSVDFGEVLPDDTLQAEFTISNQGNMPLTIEEVDPGSEHFYFSGDFPQTLDPDQEETHTVSFIPQSPGNFETVALIFSDAANNPEAELYLAGTGLDPTYVTGPEARATYLDVYPNPLSAKSVVTLDLDTRQHVTIVIYNLEGQRMDMLFEGELDAGQQRFGLGDLYKQLNPGFYILSVKSESTRTAVRMLLTD
ncbi:MAG: M14 family zinc carboxypeptidase [Bacteroidales bacterium]